MLICPRPAGSLNRAGTCGGPVFALGGGCKSSQLAYCVGRSASSAAGGRHPCGAEQVGPGVGEPWGPIRPSLLASVAASGSRSTLTRQIWTSGGQDRECWGGSATAACLVAPVLLGVSARGPAVPARRPASGDRPAARPACAAPTSPARHGGAAGNRRDPGSPTRPAARRGAPARRPPAPAGPAPRRPVRVGPPGAPDTVPLHQSPYGHPVGAELGGHLGHRPSRYQQPISQLRPQVGEAELGGPSGEPLVGGVAALPGQPLSTREQRDPALAQ